MINNKNLNKEITFFYTDGVEFQTIKPIADSAIFLGYKVKFTQDVHEKAEIGVYCQHVCYPENASLSVILLHDMDQGHNRWPDFWKHEPWNIYDIGILPGESWLRRWQACSWAPYSKPRIGVFNLGWPKADAIFQNKIAAQEQLDIMRNNLKLKHSITILYAPSWENDNKQDDFVQSLKDLPVNLLIKQAPWSDSYPEVLQNIKAMNDLHLGCAENVNIIDPGVNIFECLALSDIIVSEESSVMTEGLLLDIPSVAVMDWKVPDVSPSRFPVVSADYIVKTTKSELKNTIVELIKNLDSEKNRIIAAKNMHFSNLGKSSGSIMNLIDSIVNSQDLPFEKIQPVSRLDKVLLYKISHQVYKFRLFLSSVWKMTGLKKFWI